MERTEQFGPPRGHKWHVGHLAIEGDGDMQKYHQTSGRVALRVAVTKGFVIKGTLPLYKCLLVSWLVLCWGCCDKCWVTSYWNLAKGVTQARRERCMEPLFLFCRAVCPCFNGTGHSCSSRVAVDSCGDSCLWHLQVMNRVLLSVIDDTRCYTIHVSCWNGYFLSVHCLSTAVSEWGPRDRVTICVSAAPGDRNEGWKNFPLFHFLSSRGWRVIVCNFTSLLVLFQVPLATTPQLLKWQFGQ